jgi:Na+/H+ antiporter NhaD/arsenite permease-like protein
VATHLPAIFSLLVAAAGWFYMFYSNAASKLAGVESSHANLLRVRLRRAGGLAMILLAIAFYGGFVALDQGRGPAAAGLMAAVLVLMCAIVVLGLVDLRLTSRLRRSQRQERDNS